MEEDEFIKAANFVGAHLEGMSVPYIAGFAFAANHLDRSAVSSWNEFNQFWLAEEAEKWVKGHDPSVDWAPDGWKPLTPEGLAAHMKAWADKE